MVSIIQKVALLVSQTFGKDVTDKSLNQLRALFSLLSAKDINFNGDLIEQNKKLIAPTIHMSIYEDNDFTISLFAVKNGKSIPLHDHPGMYGIIKVIRGTFKVKSYSLIKLKDVTAPTDDLKKLALKTKHSLDKLQPAIYNGERDVSAEDSITCMLTPYENNIHEITSIKGLSAFVDILAPPYFDGERDCHFFSVLSTEFDVKLNRKVTWLVEINPPSSFWCESMKYTGPAIEL